MNFQIGDKVLVKTFYLSNAKKNLIFIAKLLPRFEGPFEVIDSGHYNVNLKLKDCRTGKTRMWGRGGGGEGGRRIVEIIIIITIIIIIVILLIVIIISIGY